jgi:hypothetical protein
MGGNTIETAIQVGVDDESNIEEVEDEVTCEGSPNDLESIDVVRIVLGKVVVKSNCSLKFQLISHDGYIMIIFSFRSSTFNVKVDLNGDTLKEMAYHIGKDEDEEESISILALCVRPTQENMLARFQTHYDGENGDKKFIIIEVRDKEELQVQITFWHEKIPRFQPHLFSCLIDSHSKTILNKLEEHNYSQAICACHELEFYELDPYIAALVKDGKLERKRRIATNRTSTSDDLLVVYPFEIKETILDTIPAELRELSDNIFSTQVSGS